MSKPFEPTIHIFGISKLDQLLRGNSFAYIDVIDNLGLEYQDIFEACGVRIRPGAVLTCKEFTTGKDKIAIVFARSRCNFDSIRKAVGRISEEVRATDEKLFDLYIRAHNEGFFTELADIPNL